MHFSVRTLVVLVVFSAVNSAEALSLYQIGNSLTRDSQSNAIEVMALAAELDWTNGYHIKTSSTIKQIYENPTPSNELSQPGPTWVEALPGNDWDALVLQPHNQGGNTMSHDIEYALKFVDDSQDAGNNFDTQLYVYSTWPTQSTGWSDWLTPVANVLTQPTIHRKEFFEHVAGRLAASVEAPVHVIPAGDVLYRIIQEIEAGTIPHLTSAADLYRDDIHLGNYGRLAAASTVLATVAGINPTGLPTTLQTSGEPETVLRIQEIAWDVVANHPWSGVAPIAGDYNGDESVDLADYQWWRGSFGKSMSYAADGNRDGVINAADYTVWRDHYQTGLNAEAAVAVPEPTGLSLLAIAAVAVLSMPRCRRHLRREIIVSQTLPAELWTGV